MISRVFFSFLLAGLLSSAMSRPLAAGEQLYTCGMHPQIIKKEPGDCPICGMRLQPVRQQGERKVRYYKSTMMPGEVSEKPGKDSMGMEMEPVYDDAPSAGRDIVIDAATTQKMNLKTAPARRGSVQKTIRALGAIGFDERGYSDVTLRFESWVEKLSVSATWDRVTKGQPLFEVYSPELYAASLNYVVARKSGGAGENPLLSAARTRLELLGLPGSYIATLDDVEEPPRTYVYRAPVEGVVLEKMVVPGQMMKAGERFFRLADLSRVWANVQLFEPDLAGLVEGQSVEIRSATGAGNPAQGKIEALLPQVQNETRTVTARVVLDNPSAFWRPGMYVEARLKTTLAASAVLVPEEAVLRSGERNTLFVAKEGGHFEPRELRLGALSDGGFYEVLEGVSEGEQVVVSGQFMLDSESQLREAIQKMIKAGAVSPETAATPHAHISSDPETAPSEVAHGTLYTCPMDEDADVVEDHPGKCPKCGMKLVPTASVDHGKQSEALWLERKGKSGASGNH